MRNDPNRLVRVSRLCWLRPSIVGGVQVSKPEPNKSNIRVVVLTHDKQELLDMGGHSQWSRAIFEAETLTRRLNECEDWTP